MRYNEIPKTKSNALRRLFIVGGLNPHQMAVKLDINYSTVLTHIKKFKQIKELYPDRLSDLRFTIPVKRKIVPPKEKYTNLINFLPTLIAADKTKRLRTTPLWRSYHVVYPDGYGEGQFNTIYTKWRLDNHISEYAISKVDRIRDEDAEILQAWRTGTNHTKWQKAVIVQDSYAGKSLVDLAEKTELTIETVERWVKIYKKRGLDGLLRKPFTYNEKIQKFLKQKRDNLIALIQQSPKMYGINKPHWSQQDLADVYIEVYNLPMTSSNVSIYLLKEGFRFKRAVQRLTSNDPKFREKVDKIKTILSRLGEKEKFFSIDEFGPCAVKIKGGRSYMKKEETKIYPFVQKSKGYIICTAALELSTNQVTHFFSRKKDTDEMIKLIDLLLIQYQNEDKLFISWDAASWHISKVLFKRIEQLNTAEYRQQHNTPALELAPLPKTAQFLNVIESVFGGLARAVIHNSNYLSVEECMCAINGHFAERNRHFQLHPKRAGKYLWGEEKVKPVFGEFQIFIDPKNGF